MPNEKTAVISNNLRPVIDEGRRADEAADPEPVVVTVRVTGFVVVDEVKVKLTG